MKKTGKFLLGRWGIPAELLHFQSANTAFIAGGHDGPQFKFPTGAPVFGDPVRVNIGWDICYDRGEDFHRPLAKMVVRVKPAGVLHEDAEIWIVETAPGELMNDRYRQLMPVSLTASNTPSMAATRWMVRVRPELEKLLPTGEERCWRKS